MVKHTADRQREGHIVRHGQGDPLGRMVLAVGGSGDLPLTALVVALILSALGLAAVVILRRKKK